MVWRSDRIARGEEMPDAPTRRWTFLTNHAHVLLCITANPDIRIRDIAEQVGITERAAHRIVADLVAEGYISATKVGRRNRYTVDPGLRFRHPLLKDHPVGNIIRVILDEISPGLPT
jgi:DNA-binding IclR family transcriptional regulator